MNESTNSNDSQETINSDIINVLLVDDQMLVAASVKRMLASEENIVFNYCQDATKALETALEVNPTVILQDLVMPDIDGLTLVKYFKAHSKLKDIPIIVLTSNADSETKKTLFEGGATDYLVKLPDKIELLARIELHAKGYRTLQQRNEAYRKVEQKQKELESELAKAGTYCISLLPEPLSQGDILTDWRFIPSTQLGGDSFGYHWIDNDHFAIYLLDVCGHGVGAALLSVSAVNVLKSQSLPNADFRLPEQVLSGLNAAFQMSDHNDLYFTMWYGVFNKNSRELKYASAGHPAALLLDSGNNLSKLDTPNFIIGGLPDFPFTSNSVNIGNSSKLFVYSDGVYEIEKTGPVDNPFEKMWTMDEMSEFVKTESIENRHEIDALYTFIKKLGGQEILDDDFSMIKIVFE
jgi:sigma-B regulation protein RsbU (phosphoserine phosphatase)